MTVLHRLTMMIVDSSDDFRLALEDSLQNSYIIYHSRNGDEALEAAKNLQPDVMVLDLMIAGLDGISLLHKLRSIGIRPMVLATTRLYNDYVFETAEELGIGYIVRKPCNPTAVAERVRDLSKRLNPQGEVKINPDQYIADYLHTLRISPRHRGYAYIKEAVLIMAENPGMPITKELYPSVCAKFHCTSSQVERSIRSAISAAWEQGLNGTWDGLLSYAPNGSAGRPSNGFLITRLAEELRLKISAEQV